MSVSTASKSQRASPGARRDGALLELRTLRYFVVAAEELHFTRAADRLYIGQQALSAALKRLESRLGVTLFDRTTRRVRLTSAGSALLPWARRILDSADLAVTAAQEADSAAVGELVLGIARSAYRFGAAVIRAMEAEAPRIRLEIRHDFSQPLFDQLLTGELDAAVLFCPDRHPALGYQRLTDQPAFAVMHPRHPLAGRSSVSMEELRAETLVLAQPRIGQGYNAMVLSLFDGDGPVPATAESQGYMGPAGLEPYEVIGINTEVALEDVPTDFELVRVPIPGRSLPFDLVWNRRDESSLIADLRAAARRIASTHRWPIDKHTA
jgi:DNA-binding transcriptional LysR family regulator